MLYLLLCVGFFEIFASNRKIVWSRFSFFFSPSSSSVRSFLWKMKNLCQKHQWLCPPVDSMDRFCCSLLLLCIHQTIIWFDHSFHFQSHHHICSGGHLNIKANLVSSIDCFYDRNSTNGFSKLGSLFSFSAQVNEETRNATRLNNTWITIDRCFSTDYSLELCLAGLLCATLCTLCLRY